MFVRNTEKKNITYSVPIEKEVTITDKKEKETTKTISCRLQFTDSARFMARALSDLVNNLAAGIIKLNVTTNMIIKNVNFAELNMKIVSAFFNT